MRRRRSEAFCPDDRTVSNGYVVYQLNGKSFSSQSQLVGGIKRRVRCFPGFYIIGEEKSTCRQGNWSKRMALCSPKSCKPLTEDINNYRFVRYSHDPEENGKYPHSTEAKVFCKEGTTMVSNTVRPICEAGQWLPSVPYCMEVIPTTPPPYAKVARSCLLPSVVHGRYLTYYERFVKNGTVLVYTCNRYAEDYYDSPVFCNDGEFSPGRPGCREKSCTLPTNTPEHVHVVSSFYGDYKVWHGLNISFVCTPGFILIGSKVNRCWYGEWSTPIPRCVRDTATDYESCGKAGKTTIRFGGRVVGGFASNSGAWPWQAGIYWQRADGNWFLFCAGTLIEKGWVLSAGHCFGYDEDIRRLQIRLGLTDRRADMGSIREQIFNVTNLFLPKGHDYIDFDYDIALLQLDGQALLNDYVRTICLPPEPINGDNLDALVPPGAFGMVTGWGHSRPVEFNESSPSIYENTLQQLQIPIRRRDECVESLANINEDISQFTPRMFCAGYSRKQRDTCFGDSGGPFMRKLKRNGNGPRRWVQVGIVSAGKGCAVIGQYAYYTHIPKLVPWINFVMSTNYTRSDGDLVQI
ncbi:putative limulus clotting factor C [Apostichopus japonicus]|uniref:Putative limulus clotting factor C n=1 Tax=Stichopus japonicus TaxID=307972 RepID=A0A2G8LG87_STIJA|nr:putative limulus clotting factor C [Apostichopus japonicus]